MFCIHILVGQIHQVGWLSRTRQHFNQAPQNCRDDPQNGNTNWFSSMRVDEQYLLHCYLREGSTFQYSSSQGHRWKGKPARGRTRSWGCTPWGQTCNRQWGAASRCTPGQPFVQAGVFCLHSGKEIFCKIKFRGWFFCSLFLCSSVW